MEPEIAEEHAMLGMRRRLIGHDYTGARAEPEAGVFKDPLAFHAEDAPQWAAAAGPERPYLALAFSGGGIRSATFSLGVLQAVAQAPSNSPVFGADQALEKRPYGSLEPGKAFCNSLLSRFDYLSTVSGGGYLGAFLVALFKTNRLRTHDGGTGPAAQALKPESATDPMPAGGRWSAADDAVAALRVEAPGRMRSREKFAGPEIINAPLAWLRENSRYLLPTGAGDAFYAAAMTVRNWAALHYVIGTLLFSVFAAMLLVRVALPMPEWVPRALVAFSAVPEPARLAGGPARALRHLGAPRVPAADPAEDSPPGAAAAPVEPETGGAFGGSGASGSLDAEAVAKDSGEEVEKDVEKDKEKGTLKKSTKEQAKHQATATDWADLVWWSPYLVPPVLVLVLLCLPMGIGFWMAYRGDDKDSAPLNKATVWSLLLVGMFSAGAAYDTGLRRWVWALLALVTAEGVLWYMLVVVRYQVGALLFRKREAAAPQPPAGSGRRYEVVSKVRVTLTQHLSLTMQLALALLLLGVLDTLGQTLYLLSASHPAGSVLGPAGLVSALVWLGKLVAGQAGAKGDRDGKGGLVAKLPLTVLAGAAGMLIMALVAVLWCFAVHWAVWQGALPPAQGAWDPTLGSQLSLLLGGALLMAVAVGQFPSFINLSSLQPFYSARLARAYLGASNRERFTDEGRRRSAAEPMAGDNLHLTDFYTLVPDTTSRPAADPTTDNPPREPAVTAQLLTLAPLHIINVTVNKTVDPGEQLVQRDRKGQPLAVLPHKFSLDGQSQRFPAPWERKALQEIERTPNLGQWVGISGAAFSTGIGRATTFGMSMLMGASNVRLGVWWGSRMPSGAQPTTWLSALERHLMRPVSAVSRVLGAVFRTQAYLSYEFRARFFGLHRQWQYLSDGGHFENTGLYELLRPQRKLGLILATDCGADPAYSFDDLANLIRLVRIDFGVEVKVETAVRDWKGLGHLFGTPEDFRPPAREPGPGATPPRARDGRCALLLKVSKDQQVLAWVVLVKPVVPADAPADVAQYWTQHPHFPQEPTTDQFFDEAQWESYRKLGNELATRLLTARVLEELARYIKLEPA